jgi:hypothetical protein
MMNNEKRVNEIIQERKNNYIKRSGQLYPNENNECKVYAKYEKGVNRVLSGARSIGGVFTLFKDISDWHMNFMQYQVLHKNNNDTAQNEFTKSTAYGYLAVKKGDESFGCWVSNVFILMDTVSLYMAQCILCGWWEKTFDIAEIMIASIDFGKTTDEEGDEIERIGCGQDDIPASWFLLELYCRLKGRDFNRENADYPELVTPYDEVLEKWDTDDLKEVNRLVYNMADYHLEQAKEPSDENDEYSEFESPELWLFPYEILAWLALRKKAGLKNPETFSHPLMNTPLAKMFLELETPLPEPEELPYANKLIAKLVENCPKMAGEVEPEDKTPKSPDEPKTAPKTGRYRATLPEDHPQAEALKTDPQAYLTYKAGEHFSNAGLEKYETDLIEWVFVE